MATPYYYYAAAFAATPLMPPLLFVGLLLAPYAMLFAKSVAFAMTARYLLSPFRWYAMIRFRRCHIYIILRYARAAADMPLSITLHTLDLMPVMLKLSAILLSLFFQLYYCCCRCHYFAVDLIVIITLFTPRPFFAAAIAVRHDIWRYFCFFISHAIAAVRFLHIIDTGARYSLLLLAIAADDSRYVIADYCLLAI